jgi:hypothetical protein
MATQYDSITDTQRAFIEAQHLFFVASAALDPNGHVNTSPKGMDTLRILTPNRVAYLDLTGSGNETSAHLRENGRITFMFCAFERPPQILRLYGRGRTILPGDADWTTLAPLFPKIIGTRQIIVADIHLVQNSCGFAVPFYDYAGERETLVKWADNKGDDGLETYHREKNSYSIDGMITDLGERALRAAEV